MPLYRYVKKTPVVLSSETGALFFFRRKRFLKLSDLPPFIIRAAASALVIVGLGLLSNVAWPIVSYQLFFAPRFSRAKIKSPIPSSSIVLKVGRSEMVEGDVDNFNGQVAGAAVVNVDQEVNLEEISNWLPSASAEASFSTETREYQVSIPKLGIEKALVKPNGNDLTKHMIQYGGTAVPGDYGNAVIFCHSVLPQFFNPKDYKTICSTLPTIEKGDEIFVDYEEIRYRFVVTEIVTVDADDFSILEQHYNRRSLTLITCVPPGTYWKRLAVIADLKAY